MQHTGAAEQSAQYKTSIVFSLAEGTPARGWDALGWAVVRVAAAAEGGATDRARATLFPRRRLRRAGAGVLFKALSCFALRGIDLTKIESRPLRSQPVLQSGGDGGVETLQFSYLFYVDFAASTADTNAQNALRHLQARLIRGATRGGASRRRAGNARGRDTRPGRRKWLFSSASSAVTSATGSRAAASRVGWCSRDEQPSCLFSFAGK